MPAADDAAGAPVSVPLGTVATALLDMGRPADALAAYQQALALNQPSPEAAFARQRVETLAQK